MITIAFTGGGTGGHIYPGLAIAGRLREMFPWRILWIGSQEGMDRALVEDAGLEFFGVPSGKLRRYFSFRNAADVFKVIRGFFAARRILKRERPALLFSKGGFVSVPPCAAAASLRIPVFTHESDFSPGLATRINLNFAEKVFTAFRETSRFFPAQFRSRVTVAGNPIRREFFSADPQAGREFLGASPRVPILLVLGGSLGARQLNELIRESLPRLRKMSMIIHQTGPHTDWDIPEDERYRPYPFIRDELPQVIAAADLVICRSGAGTIWECAALGKPMILIPLSGSGTRGDQVENADYLEKEGAALVLRGEVKADDLVAAVEALSGQEEMRESMSKAGARFAGKDAALLIAGIIGERVHKEGA